MLFNFEEFSVYGLGLKLACAKGLAICVPVHRRCKDLNIQS
jgi:hypothetical protein